MGVNGKSGGIAGNLWYSCGHAVVEYKGETPIEKMKRSLDERHKYTK